jgi:lysylphosphatidylglycerol synthetase-like protein (DUF2156 family)
MENQDLIALWKTQDAKIEQTLEINKRVLIELIHNKAQKELGILKRFKVTGVILSIPYLILLGGALAYAVLHYSSAWNYFIISLSVIFLLNLKALVDYFKHLIWISELNYEGSITEIQTKITTLQKSIVNHTRVLFLQLPFWSTFYLSNKWFPQNITWTLFVFQVFITSSFVFIALWLYRKMNASNVDKEWVQKFIVGTEWKSASNVLSFYKELQAFQNDI